MISVNVAPEFKDLVCTSSIKKAGQAALIFKSDTQQTVDLTIAIVDDKTIQELNNKYRSQDTTTDVLSFALSEPVPENDNIYLGDIVISYESAQDHANSSHHTAEEELQLLVIHGILHLLGYDHETNEDKQAMWRVKAEIIISLGLSHNLLPD